MTSAHSNAREPTRERVRATIGQVGGYWRPLAALARMQEELGELAEVLVSLTQPSSKFAERSATEPAEQRTAELGEQLACELADLWIITTALSDQFLGYVGEPDSYPRRLPPSPYLLCGLLAAAGRVARIVNHYDGPKTPRSFDGWLSLSMAVSEFHRALADIAQAHDLDLAAAVGAKLDAIPALDSGRFRAGGHDPCTAASVSRFQALSQASGSPDERVRLWGSPEWLLRSFAPNVDAIVADLGSFTKAALWEQLEGYVICGPAFTSLALLDDWLTRLLSEITVRDPMAEQYASGRLARDPTGRQYASGRLARDPTGKQYASGSLARDPTEERYLSGPLECPERRLTFNGLHLLVTDFSPLHPSGDPRHSPDVTFALLAVQHEGADPPRAQ